MNTNTFTIKFPNPDENIVPVACVLEDNATVPTRKHPTDTGYDVTIASVEFSGIKQVCNRVGHEGEHIPCYVIVDTGVRVQPQRREFALQVAPNSRIAKKPYILGNSIGIIDRNYTGTIKLVYDIESWAIMSEIEDTFKVGNVIGQLMVQHVYDMLLKKADVLASTDRGDEGFGSTESKS